MNRNKEQKALDDLKGKLAENIIEYMFRASRISGIFPIEKESDRELLYHYLEKCENLSLNIPELRARLVKRNGIPIPDFAIVTYKGGLELLEVKYRELKNPAYSIDKFEKVLNEIWNKWQCLTMLVSLDKFIETDSHFVLFTGNHLMSFENILKIKHWMISKSVLDKCENMAKNFFSDL